jgi:hypothetical protein
VTGRNAAIAWSVRWRGTTVTATPGVAPDEAASGEAGGAISGVGDGGSTAGGVGDNGGAGALSAVGDVSVGDGRAVEVVPSAIGDAFALRRFSRQRRVR